MKLNTDKCHLLLTGNKPQWKWAMVGKERIWESKSEKLLGIIIDKDLKFNQHLRSLCLKAGRKVTALRRICRYISLNQRKTLFKAFIQSQFAYCPLVWMFHGRDIENKINRLHERVLRIVYADHDSTFEELLLKDGSVTFHNRNIQLLATELYKSTNGLSPQIMNDLFEKKDTNGKYLRTQDDYRVPKINTVSFGENSLRYLGPKIWEMVPEYMRDLESLEKFKSAIKTWIPQKCPCKLCKDYIEGVGFVDVV